MPNMLTGRENFRLRHLKNGELGLLGIPFPECYGGSGGDTISYALSVEEIGKACGSTGLSYAAAVSLGAAPVYYFGTEEQKQEYLVPLATGRALGAFGLTEPNAGSDAGGTRTKARSEGDSYVISGEKCWITNAGYARTVIVTAVTGKDDNGKNIISAIIVPTDSEGFTINSEYDKMGVRGSNTSQLILDNVRVPKQNLLGSPEKGFKQFLNTLDGAEFRSPRWPSVSLKAHLRPRLHTHTNENNSAGPSPISRRFSSSLPTWPWKLSLPAIWC